jgi:hypothetical protein
MTAMLASSGPEDTHNPTIAFGTSMVALIGRPEAGGPFVGVVLIIEPSLFEEGEISFHAGETLGGVIRSTGDRDTQVTLGYIGNGKVVFEEAGTNPGDSVKGSFSGYFVPSALDYASE